MVTDMSSPNSATLSFLSKSLWSRPDAVALLQVGLSLTPRVDGVQAHQQHALWTSECLVDRCGAEEVLSAFDRVRVSPALLVVEAK